MSLTSSRYRTIVFLAAGGLAAAAATGAVGGASAATTSYGVSGCSAALLQLSVGGNAIPIPAASCPDDGDVFVPPIDVPIDAQDGVHAQVLYEYASASPDPGRHNAEAGVAKLVVLLQGHTIAADVLTSQADCTNGQPSGQSQVADLNLDGNHLTVPDTLMQPHHLVIDQLSPVATVDMNRQDTPAPTTTSTTTPAGTTVTTTRSLTQTALEVKALIGTPLEVDLVVAQTHVDCTTSVFTPTPPPPPPGNDKDGWMNGGGTMVDSAGTTVDPGTQVSHGFVLPCHVGQTPPAGTNLVVNGDFGHFKLTTVTDAHCTDDPNQGDPENPKAGFNTLNGSGTGTCDGKDATATWHFTDEGEPNTADEATIHIRGGCTLDVAGILTNGNNQAHPLPTGSSNKNAKQH